VAAAANADGGSAFLSSQGSVLQVFVLLGPGVSGSDFPYWGVEYDGCGLATSGTGTLFIGTYDALSGSVVTAPLTESVDC